MKISVDDLSTYRGSGLELSHKESNGVINAFEKISIVTLRTVVIDRPLLISVSAIQPPMLAKAAIVNHGNTHNSPDSVRLNFNT